jgi:hypothetical protein
MVSKKKLATTAVATFGVAMTSMYVSHDMQADIMDLTYFGGNATATNPFFLGSGSPFYIAIDQVSSSAFLQWNDTFGGTGRTCPFFVSSIIQGPESMDVVMSGDVIDPATFVGRTNGTGAPAALGGGTEFDGTGSAFIAVRPRAFQGNVMWFHISYTVDGPIVYGDGEYGSMGEALTVGGSGGCPFMLGDMNMDGMLSLLDVSPFVTALTSGTFVCQGDFTGDGAITLLDVAGFVAALTGG